MSLKDWAPDPGYLGVSCIDSLTVCQQAGDLHDMPQMTREEARAALEAVDDAFDVVEAWLRLGGTQGPLSVEMPAELDGVEGPTAIAYDLGIRGRRGASADLYERHARAVAKRFLVGIEAHPQWRDLPVEHVNFRSRHGWLDDEDHVKIGDLMPSGFQVGWAANFAKFIVGAMPCPNPSIVTMGEKAATREGVEEMVAKVNDILRGAR